MIKDIMYELKEIIIKILTMLIDNYHYIKDWYYY